MQPPPRASGPYIQAGDKSVAELARKLGVSETAIRHWKGRRDTSPLHPLHPGRRNRRRIHRRFGDLYWTRRETGTGRHPFVRICTAMT
jgi:hypothetical protein